MKIKFTATWLPLSPLIRLWTWSKCSHCEFEFSDGMVIVAAMEAGRVIATKNRKHTWEYEFDLPKEKEDILREWAEGEIGKPYDYTALAPINVLIPRTKKQWKNDDLWMCSEFCAMGLEKIGIKLFPDNYRKITPGDLMRKFQKGDHHATN